MKAAEGGDKGGQQFWALIQRNLPETAIGVYFVNTLLSPSLGRLSSTEPMGWASRCITLFNGVRSTQIRTRLLGFGTRTMLEHHSVGTATGERMACRGIESISFFALGNNGWGTFLGCRCKVALHLGWAWSDIWFPVFPDHWKAEEILQWNLLVFTSPIRTIKPRSTRAFLLKRE